MSIETPPPHTRRKRYRGTHPRKFAEKYKELTPQNYATDIDKVIARGQTPAGMHRPICVDEILTILNPQPGDVALDATLGFGGHSSALLPRLWPGGKLFAVDVDAIELPRTEARLRAQGFGEDELVIRKMNFAGVAQLLADAGGGFDCILADLGVSSMQLDDPARGFSYKNDGPLDLRLNPTRGAPASALLQAVDAVALADSPARAAADARSSSAVIRRRARSSGLSVSGAPRSSSDASAAASASGADERSRTSPGVRVPAPVRGVGSSRSCIARLAS